MKDVAVGSVELKYAPKPDLYAIFIHTDAPEYDRLRMP